MSGFLARVAGFCLARPVAVLAAVALLTVLGLVAAFRLEPDAGTDQLVDRDSDAYQATEEFKREFGDDAIAVLVRGDLEQLVLTSKLGTLLALESCLSGSAPGGQVFGEGEPAPAPCAELASSKPARVVYGPATFLNQFATQASSLLSQQAQAAVEDARRAAAAAALDARRQGLAEEAQRAAGLAAAQEVLTVFQQQVIELGVRYGQYNVPSLDDPRFVSSVVFDPREAGQPKPRFSYLFPSGESALISVRLRPELDDTEREAAIEQVRAAVADPAFAIRDASYVVSGVPVVVEGVADELSGQLLLLLVVALGAMALTLALLFGPPLRLLPLAAALATAALVFGGLALAGGSLTLAVLAVLPVLIGLAVDYAIQFQARFREAHESGAPPARAALAAAAAGGPVIGTALLATCAGFAVLLAWPLPVINAFGALLLVGIAVAYALALCAGLSLMALSAGRRRPARRPLPGAEAFAAVAASGRRLAARVREAGKRTLAVSVRAPERILLAAVVLSLAGWGLGTRTDVIADIRELLPRDVAALQEVEELEEGTGVSGEIDIIVSAADLTDPAVVAWMGDLKQRVLARSGFGSESDSCIEQDSRLCPSIALPDLFTASEGELTQGRIRRVLSLLPTYFSQAVVSRDPDGGLGSTAVIAFGIKVMPFDEQEELIDGIRAELDPPGTEADPPPGVEADVVGLPVLVADASAGLSGDRHLLTLLGLVAVALTLLLVLRSPRRALVPLIPIVLATGLSSLAVWLLGIELNPMSATLGVLVIAIATEFSVLLCARYEEERRRGATIAAALRITYGRTGRAVLASGSTAIAGFAVLIVSGIPLLRDFGLVTVLDLGIALAAVLFILPAALVWVERRAERAGQPSSAPAGGQRTGATESLPGAEPALSAPEARR